MEIFDHLKGFIRGNYQLGKTFLSLIKLEAKLAGLSVLPLLLNIIFLLVIMLTTWIFGMFLLQYSFFLLVGSFLGSIGLVVGFNLIIFLLLIKYLSSNLRKMSFEKTREFLSTNKRSDYEPSSSNATDYSDAKQIVPPTE